MGQLDFDKRANLGSSPNNAISINHHASFVERRDEHNESGIDEYMMKPLATKGSNELTHQTMLGPSKDTTRDLLEIENN